ncbi:MAG: ABC transporter permease [Muribaculaceae bacterium]|nr:ABC transporter permease [Muribaculaceae bacterium]
MVDLAKEIWQTMRTNKLRTLLTGISVSWGIFMLILLLAISKGVVNSSKEFADRNDPNRITLWGGMTSKPYKGYKEGRYIPLKGSNFDIIKDSDPEKIVQVTGDVSFTATISTDKDYLTTNECQGVFPNKFNGQYKIIYGRPINEADMRGKRKSIVLPKKYAAMLFDEQATSVGKSVRVGDLGFTLVGIYDHKWNTDVFIPYSTAVALNGYTDNLDNIEVHITGIRDADESGAVEKNVVGALAKADNFDPGDNSAIHTYDRFASYLEGQKANDILDTTMWVIGILTLITGIVGVSNIMFVSVRERVHEIGIRRAIGAKPGSILLQVVMESVALTTCFGYIGIVLGTAATELVKKLFEGSEFMSMAPSVDLGIALKVTIALIAAGAMAGLFPAMKAVKVKPVEALRDE